MSTSPGKGGAKYALDVTSKLLPRFGAEIIESFSLPSFTQNFDGDKGILDSDLSKNHQTAVQSFLSSF
jgi:hypothetical protein